MTDYWYNRWYWDDSAWVQTPTTLYSTCTITSSSTATMQFTNTTANIGTQYYIGDGSQWLPVGYGRYSMSNGPGSMNNRLWKQWNADYVKDNADYVKDKEEARRLAELEDERRQVAAHIRVLAECVLAAQAQGTRMVEFAVARLEEYDDDEWRTVEDAYQRGSEVAIEAQRVRLRVAADHAEAQRKAEVLLVSILTAEQKREWLEHKRVTHVSKSGRVWRLFPAWGGGVCLMNRDIDTRRATLCLHTAERIPEADNIVALLLSLRHGEEDHLIGIANLHAGDWTDDELQIRREHRYGRAPVVEADVRRAARAERIALAAIDNEEMPA